MNARVAGGLAELKSLAREWLREILSGWDRFWFQPTHAHTLCLIRVLAGAMMLYTHLVWSLRLGDFLGPDAWTSTDFSRQLHSNDYAWSFWWYVTDMRLVWTLHVAGLIVFSLFTLGLFSRTMSVLAWLLTISYCHRLTGALFGLDQVNAMLAMYLMVGPCGRHYSLDSWLARRRRRHASDTASPHAVGKSGKSPSSKTVPAKTVPAKTVPAKTGPAKTGPAKTGPGRAGDRGLSGPERRETLSEETPSVSANIAIRLIQLHLCVIYLFGGIGKLRGAAWWDGSAVWMSISNYEYQSWNITGLGHYPLLIAGLTHLTVLWETFYCVLVWPRMTRPLALSVAVMVHGGICLFLGMITFGLAMIIANLAFVSSGAVRGLLRD